eukprot:6910402-Alexandrium_andersonii.AAC.1
MGTRMLLHRRPCGISVLASRLMVVWSWRSSAGALGGVCGLARPWGRRCGTAWARPRISPSCGARSPNKPSST